MNSSFVYLEVRAPNARSCGSRILLGHQVQGVSVVLDQDMKIVINSILLGITLPSSGGLPATDPNQEPDYAICNFPKLYSGFLCIGFQVIIPYLSCVIHDRVLR